jgi:hypothetical protein
MRPFKKLALCCALAAAAAASGASAQTLASTSTYAGLVWAFSTGHPGFSGCGTLVLDATGAVGLSDNFSMYGELQCPALGGSYASSGSAFFSNAGNFNMTVSLSVTHNLVCNVDGFSLSGSCPIFDNLGNQTGTAFISLL